MAGLAPGSDGSSISCASCPTSRDHLHGEYEQGFLLADYVPCRFDPPLPLLPALLEPAQATFVRGDNAALDLVRPALPVEQVCQARMLLVEAAVQVPLLDLGSILLLGRAAAPLGPVAFAQALHRDPVASLGKSLQIHIEISR